MYSLILLVAAAVCGVVSCANGGGNPQLIEVPQDQNHFLGAVVEFKCTSLNYEALLWYYNDNDGMQHDVCENDVCTSYYQNDTLDIRSFSIMANTSWIPGESATFACGGFFINPYGTNKSLPATLGIQGVPDAITGFKGDNTSSTTIVFTWEPPEHLPSLPPCCLHYRINITHLSTGDVVLINDTLKSSTIEFTIIEERLCDALIVNIVPYNQVGAGSMFAGTWSLGGFFQTNTAIPTLYYVSGTSLLQLDINVHIIGYCLLQLNNVTFVLRCPNAADPLVDVQYIDELIDRPTDGSNVKSLDVRLRQDVPLQYHHQTCQWHIALDNNVDFNANLKIFDVINATYSTEPGRVCVRCEYVQSSPAKGCHAHLTLLSSSIHTFTDSINISISRDYGCIEVSDEGLYTLAVHDWNDDGSISDEPVTTFHRIYIPLPSSSSAVTPSVTRQPTITDEVGVIVGVTVPVGLIVLAVLVLGSVIILAYIICVKGKNRDQPPIFHRNVNTDGYNNDYELDDGVTPTAGENVNNKVELMKLVRTKVEGYCEKIEYDRQVNDQPYQCEELHNPRDRDTLRLRVKPINISDN
jgi:hypothetical protein